MNTSLASSVQQYQNAYDKAIELFDVFGTSGTPELLRMQISLAEEIQRFLNVSGLTWGDMGNLGRHLTFLRHYLEKDEKESCAQDIKDIVFYDLPIALRNLVDKVSEEQHLDQRLKDDVLPLVQGGHYDSAIRKIFVLLTERLRRVFEVAEDLDGEGLVNLVFGKGDKIPVALDEQKSRLCEI